MWVKLDDRLWSHPKVAELQHQCQAIGFWTLCASFCGQQDTDGSVTVRQVAAVAASAGETKWKQLVADLVHVGLWEEDGPDAWRFHDWDKLNPPSQKLAEQAEAKRQDNARRQKAWRERNAAEDDSRTVTPSLRNAESNALRNALREPSRNGGRNASVTHPSRPDPIEVTPTGVTSVGVTHADPDAEDPHSTDLVSIDDPDTLVVRVHNTPPIPTTSQGHRIPKPFPVTDDLIAWADGHCPGVNLQRETERFANYWTAKAGAGARKADWAATWRNWMLKAADELPANTRAGYQPGQRLSVETRRMLDAQALIQRYEAEDAEAIA